MSVYFVLDFVNFWRAIYLIKFFWLAWLTVELPGKRARPSSISPRMQPRLHMSTPFVYLFAASRISGLRYHRVATYSCSLLGCLRFSTSFKNMRKNTNVLRSIIYLSTKRRFAFTASENFFYQRIVCQASASMRLFRLKERKKAIEKRRSWYD